MEAYTVSLLKAYWGDKATAENDYCFDYLPRISGDHSIYASVLGMLDGTVDGMIVAGQNPASAPPTSPAPLRDGRAGLARGARHVRGRDR